MSWYVHRPLSDKTWLRPPSARKYHQFDTRWSDTLELLRKEIAHLKGRQVVLEVDVREHDVRLDGTLRSNARTPESPAIVVAFESKHGPMLYRSDKYDGSYRMPAWQANVRAVALTLQALRAVDRYGATETGQQYAGFKALPAGRAMPASHMTSDEAWSILGSFSKVPIATIRRDALLDPAVLPALRKRARAFAHPDRHEGDRTLWNQVEEAARVLGVDR